MNISPIKIVALNLDGGGARLGPLCAYLADILVLTEWRDTAQGREIADWGGRVGLHCKWLADGAAANGVFLAAKASFTLSGVTPRCARQV